MILRTSFKIRFEVAKKTLFGTSASEQLNVQKMRLHAKQEPQLRRALQRQVDKMNSRKSFVEFPIHLIYED